MLFGSKLLFGLPYISAIIYPGQTFRINSGWSTADLPTNSMLISFPHKGLLDNNIISLPQMIDTKGVGS